jgi:hypothetical protein
MATDLATTTDEPRPAKAPVTSGGKLAAFVPNNLEEAWRLAGALAGSGMTPKAYGNDQNKVMVGIIAGAEVGLTPFAALQSIAVIGNNPSLWGDGALALVQASGLLDDMEETDDGQTATCRLNRQGRKTAIVRTFSMDDAKKAGLAGKAGPWTQYPARMRQMRARAFALRDGFSDVLKGLHIVEEVRDYSPMGAALPTAAPLSAAMIVDQSRTGLDDDNDGTLAPDNPAAAEGPDDSQRGEAHSTGGMADEIIGRVEKAEVIADVLAIESDYQANLRGMLDVGDQDRIETSIGDAKLRLKGGK